MPDLTSQVQCIDYLLRGVRMWQEHLGSCYITLFEKFTHIHTCITLFCSASLHVE